MRPPAPLPACSAIPAQTMSSSTMASCALTENRFTFEVTRRPNQLMPSVTPPKARIQIPRSTCGTKVPSATAIIT